MGGVGVAVRIIIVGVGVGGISVGVGGAVGGGGVVGVGVLVGVFVGGGSVGSSVGGCVGGLVGGRVGGSVGRSGRFLQHTAALPQLHARVLHSRLSPSGSEGSFIGHSALQYALQNPSPVPTPPSVEQYPTSGFCVTVQAPVLGGGLSSSSSSSALHGSQYDPVPKLHAGPAFPSGEQPCLWQICVPGLPSSVVQGAGYVSKQCL